MLKEPIAVYIEDDDDWRADVEKYIKRSSGLRFRDFVSASSVEEVRSQLASISGPVIILMDLRLGKERVNYKGFDWLLEESEDFRNRHTKTSVFVISGQLNELTEATLIRKGIPKDHIYDKGDWLENQNEFLDVLRREVSNMADQSESVQSIDPYLRHTLQATEEEISRDISETGAGPENPVLVPMLVRAKDKFWEYDKIPDLQALGQIDNIFSCLGSLRTVSALQKDPEVLKVEASRPAADPDCRKSLPAINADAVHQRIGEKGDRALIGIIDAGIDVLHKAFRDSTGRHTRILAIWDQTDPTGPPPSGQKLGTEHLRKTINRYIEEGKVPTNLEAISKDHGTHVASIAAGRPISRFACGVAPESKIIVVIPDLDVPPDKPSSLGYSISHHLALQYIRNFAEEEGLPVVINVSQGMNAGAHDGTSDLEKGFDLIADNGRLPGIVVVKSAGNERTHKGHAKLQMGKNASEFLHWASRKPRRGMDVIELWFKANDNFKFRLWDPKKNKTEWVGWSHRSENGSFPSGNGYLIDFTRYDPDNGDSRLLITVTARAANTILLGKWSLEIESGIVNTSGEINAWLERNNARPIAFTNHISEELTLSIPGTAHNVICVGSVSSSNPYRIADYSSYGPTRDGRKKPDLAAPGEKISAARSQTINGVVQMSGTSMAAPHVTGAIALLFSLWEKQRTQIPNWQQYNAAQIQAAITQRSQNYNGNWHPGIGFGILDVENFLRDLGNL